MKSDPLEISNLISQKIIDSQSQNIKLIKNSWNNNTDNRKSIWINDIFIYLFVTNLLFVQTNLDFFRFYSPSKFHHFFQRDRKVFTNQIVVIT